ncbi:helix-turn-helix domain-containing protein [Streptomyces sp. NPDC093707]|uniref:helix-turn-helix domain-containing protein n=1 Tax=Streptomyces sp. NPDC093707 TaxID=3154984 RepID=UPI00345008F8
MEPRAHRPPPGADSAVLDAKGLRALAHPVRVRVLGMLRKHGPSTATGLAERLGVKSGSASYHVRQLAAAGFVEEDTARGNARDRWWRAVHEMTSFEDPELFAQEPEAALAYLRSVAAAYTLRTQRALHELPLMPTAWRNTFDLSDWPLRLTPEEADTLQRELAALLTRYRRDTPEAAATAPEGAARVAVITHIVPELSELSEIPEISELRERPDPSALPELPESAGSGGPAVPSAPGTASDPVTS